MLTSRFLNTLFSLFPVENFTTSTLSVDPIQISKLSSNSIEIIWKTAKVDEYLLHHSGPDGNVISDIVPNDATSDMFLYYTFNNLLPGTQYSISVISLENREAMDTLSVMQYTGEPWMSEWMIDGKYEWRIWWMQYLMTIMNECFDSNFGCDLTLITTMNE